MAFRAPVIQGQAGTTSVTTHTPAQVANVSGDLLLLWIGFVNNSGPPTVTTPAGWTLEMGPETQDDTRAYLFWKESTGDEAFPDLELSSAREASMLSGVVPDVDFVNGPFGDFSQNNTTNNSSFGSVTTIQANSWVMYWMTMHRRNAGWNGGNVTPNSVFAASAQTGTSSNVDTFSQAAYDFAAAVGSTLNPQRPNQSEDNVKRTFEVRTLGNNIPALLEDFSLGAQPTPTPAQNASDEFREAFQDSGYSFRGIHDAPKTFDANTDVDVANNRITLTGHGYDEAWVVRAVAGSGTLPAGLVDGDFYQVKPIDADTVELVDQNATINAAGEFYMNGSTKRASVTITAAGSGTCQLEDCGFVWSGDGDNIDRWNAASGGVTAFSGSWNGNAVGPNGCPVGYARTFATPRDMTNDIIFTEMRYGTSSAEFREQGIMFIDANNEWIAWNAYEAGAGAGNIFGNAGRPTLVKMSDINSFAGIGRSYKSGGMVDVTQIKHMIFYNADDYTTGQSETNNSMSDPRLWTPPRIYGGSPTNPLTWDDIAKKVAAKVKDYFAETPADFSVAILRCPIIIGGPGLETHLVEDAKALAVPSIGDNQIDFRIYIKEFEIELQLQPGDTYEQTNTLISASNIKATERHGIDAAGTTNFSGRLFSNLNPILDSDAVYVRPTIIGAEQVVDNGATIQSGFFGVSPAVGADNGLVTWGGSTAITGSTFEATDDLVDGHAIIITTPGTYSFTGLTFNGFGLDGASNAAIYNNSGGAVTINVSGGSTPTVRDGVGASTTVVAGAQLTFTGLQLNSEVRAYLGTDPNTATEIAGVENSGSIFSFSQSVAGQAGFVVIFALGFLPVRLSIIYSATDVSIPIQQVADRQFENP